MSRYFDLVQACLNAGDFGQLASLLTVPGGKKLPNPVVNELVQHMQFGNVDMRVAQLPAPYNLIMTNFCMLFSPSITGDMKHEKTIESLQTFLKYFSGKDGNAEVPILKVLCDNSYRIADDLDRTALLIGGKSAEHLEVVARLLPRCFTTCLTDRSPPESSKKWAALKIVVTLFRVYFRLNTLRLCGNIVRALEQASDFPAIGEFPKAEAISYWYYRARLAVHQKDFKAAERMLEDALRICHPDDLTHKREILTYLVPLKIIHGVLPKRDLLARYGLDREYGQLTEAVRTGNLLLFEQVLADNQAFFMQKELFLIIQLHLKNLILRNLFRRIVLVASSMPGATDSRLPLSSLQAGFAVYKLEQGRDEVECWLANLISEGYVKGYISHDKGILVLSKKNPFPPPSTLF